VDNWGASASQCIIPGAGYPSYPWTRGFGPASSSGFGSFGSWSGLCDNKIITLDLVDQALPIHPVGIVYIFKDLSDNLYITVSVNATWKPNKATWTPADSFHGQYLHVQPGFGAPYGPTTTGSALLWNTLFGSNALIAPYTNQLTPTSSK
jgi:hypothetical protein